MVICGIHKPDSFFYIYAVCKMFPINFILFFEVFYVATHTVSSQTSCCPGTCYLLSQLLSGSGGIRTTDLRVMSPTSYQLLYPAIYFKCFSKTRFYIDGVIYKNITHKIICGMNLYKKHYIFKELIYLCLDIQ